MYSSSKAAGKGQLSQSALSYLQSLEQSTKKLKAGANEKPKPLVGLSSRRGSLSSMISQLRSGKSLDSSDDEDVLNESFGKLSSILDESSESSGREKVLLDLNFDPLPKSSSNRALPGLVAQVGRSSISELRELRNSIDQSLQQPIQQNLKKDSARGVNEKPKARKSLFKKQESEELSEVEEEVETEREEPKKSTAPKKSPFKNAVESGSSDLESIDFEVPSKPVERLRGRKVSFRTPTPSDSSTSKISSAESSSRSESSSQSSSSSSSSKSSSVSSSSDASTTKASSSRASSSSSHSSSRSSSNVKRSEKAESDGYDSDFEGRSPSRKEVVEEIVEEPRELDLVPVPEERKQPLKVVEKSPSPPVEVQIIEKVYSLSNTQQKISSRETSTPVVDRAVEREILQEMMQRYMAENKPTTSQEMAMQEKRPVAVTSETQTEDYFSPQSKKKEISPLQEALLVSDGVQEALQSVIKAHIQMVDEMNRLEWETKKKWQQELDRLKAVVDSPSMNRLTRLIDERNRKG